MIRVILYFALMITDTGEVIKFDNPRGFETMIDCQDEIKKLKSQPVPDGLTLKVLCWMPSEDKSDE